MNPAQEEEFSQRWRVARACARCHRLKSKCIYEDPTYSSCRRCYDLGVKCSVDEDPTANDAKKRRSTISASQVAARIEKLLLRAEKELDAVHQQEGEMDPATASKFLLHSAKLQQIVAKLSLLAGTPESTKPSNELPELPSGANIAHHVLYTHRFLDENEARRRFTFFQQHMLTYYPLISLPQKLQKFDMLLQASPLLLLTCVYVTTINDFAISDRETNRHLNATLGHYIYRYLAEKVYVSASDFSYHMVLACLVLSLWCLPPDRVGQFKSQMELMTSFNLSLCIDVGNVTMYEIEAVVKDDSFERNNLRCFLGLYCCAGSLGFSLPRFKLVAWSRRHELAIDSLLVLLQDGVIPLRNDRFLCYYAKVIRVGQELFDYFAVNGVSMHFLSSEEKSGGLGGLRLPLSELEAGNLPLTDITKVLESYEKRLVNVLCESGLISQDLRPNKEAPNEKYALILTYYQIMMMSHDNLVSWCICRLDAERKGSVESTLDPALIIRHIVNFGEICEKILLCFIDINSEPTTTYPTFFYYRALHALISLIRLLVLVQSEKLSSYFSDLGLVRFNLKDMYDRVTAIIDNNQKLFDLTICERVALILQKISRWVNVVGNYGSSSVGKHGHLDFMKLTDMSKGQEIEKLAGPEEPSRKRTKLDSGETIVLEKTTIEDNNLLSRTDTLPEIQRVVPDPSELTRFTTNYSVQDIFKEIDEDILRYLNPFETVDPDGFTSSFFNEYLSKDFY